MNKCKCGCGADVKGIWSKGHCNRKPKKEVVLCMCGCGKLAQPGRRWLSGHNSKSKEDKEFKREMFKRLWDEGKFERRQVWNEGLTVETSEKLRNVGRKISASYTEERRKEYSEFAKKNNVRPPLMTGSKHPNWKGGLTDIQHLVRGSKRLYDIWKFPILKRDNFTCTRCQSNKNLEVHHDKISMSEIFHIIVQIRKEEYTWEEKKEFVDQVIAYHIFNAVSGVTLCERCHADIHKQKSCGIISLEELNKS